VKNGARKFTVSGPGADETKGCISELVGISYGQTLASAHALAGGDPCCWYVRNEDGDCEARIELHEDRTISAVRIAFV